MGPCIIKNYESRINNTLLPCVVENAEYSLTAYVIEKVKKEGLLKKCNEKM